MGFRMPMTKDERKEIKRLLLLGMSCTQIAQRINRSKNSVVTEVRINGGKENYDPIKADERAVVVHRQGRESMMRKQQIAANDQVNRQRYDHCKDLINSQGREIDELKEHIQIILHNMKSPKAKVFTDGRRASNIERRLKALEERYVVKKPHNGEAAPDNERLIYASEWEKYHKWPHHSLMLSFIKDRQTNGFSDCCFKIGKRWMVDEGKFMIWARKYKEEMLSKAKEV